jgi:predicted deacetylase
MSDGTINMGPSLPTHRHPILSFRSRLSLLFALLLPGLAPAVHSSPATDSLVFIIRVDDILTRSLQYSRTIVPFEEVVEQRGGRVSWAVIPHRLIEPANADGALAEELRRTFARGHEISLHGYTHICTRCGLSSHEMYCTVNRTAFSYSEQRQLVEDGTSILEDQIGMRPTSFVPPGHAMDATTMRVLTDLGYDVLSTTDVSRAFVHPGLYNLGNPREYTWAMTESMYQGELTKALADIRASGGFFNLLLHDPFTRPGYLNGVVLRWTGELMDSLNVEYGDRMRYMTLSEAASAFTGGAVSANPEAVAEAFGIDAVWPSPASGDLYFSMHHDQPGPVDVLLFDLSGRQMGAYTALAAPGSVHSELRIDVSGLPSGVYLYRARQGSRTSGGTFVVAR